MIHLEKDEQMDSELKKKKTYNQSGLLVFVLFRKRGNVYGNCELESNEGNCSFTALRFIVRTNARAIRRGPVT